MFANRYGHFDSTGRIFTITDPQTPMPWVNVVCNGRYGFVVSQNGGGFSWLDNSQLNVLTRWDMDLARDCAGRYLYLSDLDSGDIWSLAPSPCRPAYESYECEHTQGATTFRTQHAGIGAQWTLAVATDDPVEIWSVELENKGPSPRRLRISSFFEWCCGVAPDVKREFHRLFFTVSHDDARRAIFATRNMWDVPQRSEREHWNRPWPYIAAHSLGQSSIPLIRTHAVGDKSTFFGRYGEARSPELMRLAAAPAVAGMGRFGDASAAVGGDFTLASGQRISLHFITAIDETRQLLESHLDTYSKHAAAARVIDDSTISWQDRLESTTIETASPDFDLLNNHWLPYQAISGRLWGRTGYYQQSGAFGFRDQLQDSQVWLPIEPERCREQILRHAAHQFANGSVYHWWHPLTEMGLRTACSDDYLWLPFVVVNYLKETGDFGLLRTTAPFVDDDTPTTILEHCRRAIERAFTRLSPRGLPLIGSCDWNDGLSALGVGEKGESVWLAWFLIGLLADVATVADRIGDPASASILRHRREKLIAAVNEHAWDGQWFARATRDDGTWIGSAANTDGRIYLNAQTWAVLSGGAAAGVTSAEREAEAWTSVKRELLGEMGPLLLSPAYTIPDDSIGYITRYAPGSRENGGVYMHAATWALMAACQRRDTAAVRQIWGAISPPTRATGNDAEGYRAEPYVMPGNVDGPRSETPGKAGWTWYTGSAAWLNRVSLEWVLGIRPVWEGLMIDPCPMPELGKVEAARTWRGRRIRVKFDARAFAPGAPARLRVCGADLTGNVIMPESLPQGEGEELVVEVNWGPKASVVVGNSGAGGSLIASGRHA
ncbi:MAG: glycosyl transferase family 36 [Phycisphaerales bacterium]|nr:glycosyl transferase family 36 [Phycisphaerales bacterium]